MKARHMILLLLLMFLTGCDQFYEPKITNAFGTDVAVTVTYSNGEVTRTIWPSCRTAFVGKEGLQIEKVSIEKDGNLLREFTSDEVRSLVEKEKGVHGYSEWSVGPEGASLITREGAGSCAQQASKN